MYHPLLTSACRHKHDWICFSKHQSKWCYWNHFWLRLQWKQLLEPTLVLHNVFLFCLCTMFNMIYLMKLFIFKQFFYYYYSFKFFFQMNCLFFCVCKCQLNVNLQQLSLQTANELLQSDVREDVPGWSELSQTSPQHWRKERTTPKETWGDDSRNRRIAWLHFVLFFFT